MMLDRQPQLAMRMAELARVAAQARTPEDILIGVTAAAVDLIPGVDTAGILLIKKDGFDSIAGTTDEPHHLDDLQMTFQEGPCVQAALAEPVVRTNDFRKESRWPRYAPAAVESGVLSGLSFKLFTADRTAGALNLFSYETNTWTTDDETTGMILAAHAAAAVLANQENIQLEAAILTRDRIGQAKGIIMERFQVDEVRAFDMLKQLSQESNTKLTEIAERVIASRGK
jgi:GAF domain-containing protein